MHIYHDSDECHISPKHYLQCIEFGCQPTHSFRILTRILKMAGVLFSVLFTETVLYTTVCHHWSHLLSVSKPNLKELEKELSHSLP